MIGNRRAILAGGNRPLLQSWDFTKAASLPFWLSLSRASGPATYFDSTGLMHVLSAANIPRFDWTGGVNCGLLIEAAATNLVPYSGSIGGTDWGSWGGVYAAPTVTINNAVAPDGTTTATKMVLPSSVGMTQGAGSQYTEIQSNAITISSALQYTTSTFIKGASGGEAYYAFAAVAGAPYTIYSQALLALTTSFVRVSSVSLTLSYTNANINYGVNSGGVYSVPLQSGQAASTSFLWGSQHEAGTFPTSYIPTTSASATRAADALSATAFVNNPAVIQYKSEATGVVARKVLTTLSAISSETSEWIQSIGIFAIGTPTAYLNANLTVGAAYR